MVGDMSTYVEMHFGVLAVMGGYGQYMLRCIMCPRWHGKGFIINAEIGFSLR
jgi:hypothetical protein